MLLVDQIHVLNGQVDTYSILSVCTKIVFSRTVFILAYILVFFERTVRYSLLGQLFSFEFKEIRKLQGSSLIPTMKLAQKSTPRSNCRSLCRQVVLVRMYIQYIHTVRTYVCFVCILSMLFSVLYMS